MASPGKNRSGGGDEILPESDYRSQCGGHAAGVVPQPARFH